MLYVGVMRAFPQMSEFAEYALVISTFWRLYPQGFLSVLIRLPPPTQNFMDSWASCASGM
jgi:hypothetical protein